MIGHSINDQFIRLSSHVVGFIRRRCLVVPDVSDRRGRLHALLNGYGGETAIVVRLGHVKPYPVVSIQGANYGVGRTSSDINEGPQIVILDSSIGRKRACSRVKPP